MWKVWFFFYIIIPGAIISTAIQRDAVKNLLEN